MKDFMKRYSYESVHLFLNQVAIGLFGMTLALAAGMAENDILKHMTSIFSIAFFLFLQYVVMWKIGTNDRVSCDLGKQEKNYWVPVKMWLLANSLNFLLALLISLGVWLSDIGVFGAIGSVAATIKLIIEGMYVGVLSFHIGGAALNSYWFVHFLTPLPALATVFIAYVLGFNNVTLKSKNNKIIKK